MDGYNTFVLILGLIFTAIISGLWVAAANFGIIPALTTLKDSATSTFDRRVIRPKTRRFLQVCAYLIGLAIFAWPLYTEIGSAPNGLVVLENGVWQPHEFAFVWEWGKFANLPGDITQSSHVNVITSNPKNRKISYNLSARITDPNKYFQVTSHIKKNSESIREDISDLLRYWCYEFNEANSKDLATLYNPDSHFQQDKFNELVENWMNSKLADSGLEIKGRGFSIE